MDENNIFKTLFTANNIFTSMDELSAEEALTVVKAASLLAEHTNHELADIISLIFDMLTENEYFAKDYDPDNYLYGALANMPYRAIKEEVEEEKEAEEEKTYVIPYIMRKHDMPKLPAPPSDFANAAAMNLPEHKVYETIEDAMVDIAANNPSLLSMLKQARIPGMEEDYVTKLFLITFGVSDNMAVSIDEIS